MSGVGVIRSSLLSGRLSKLSQLSMFSFSRRSFPKPTDIDFPKLEIKYLEMQQNVSHFLEESG